METKLAAVVLLVNRARWYESRAWHPAHIFWRKALSIRAVAMQLAASIHGYTLHGQMELPL